MDITEFGKNGQRRSSSTLRQALTLNYKLETLADERENKKFVLQHTFEAEMPDIYEKGSSKSFAAYEFFKDKTLEQVPYRILEIIKASYGIPLEIPIQHRVEELTQQYILEKPDWIELIKAQEGWQKPNKKDFVKNVWETIAHPFAAAASDQTQSE